MAGYLRKAAFGKGSRLFQLIQFAGEFYAGDG